MVLWRAFVNTSCYILFSCFRSAEAFPFSASTLCAFRSDVKYSIDFPWYCVVPWKGGMVLEFGDVYYYCHDFFSDFVYCLCLKL
jgi:hypothetical protein